MAVCVAVTVGTVVGMAVDLRIFDFHGRDGVEGIKIGSGICVQRRDVNGSLDIFDEKTDGTAKVEEKRKRKKRGKRQRPISRLAAPTRALGPHVFLASQCYVLIVQSGSPCPYQC